MDGVEECARRPRRSFSRHRRARRGGGAEQGRRGRGSVVVVVGQAASPSQSSRSCSTSSATATASSLPLSQATCGPHSFASLDGYARKSRPYFSDHVLRMSSLTPLSPPRAANLPNAAMNALPIPLYPTKRLSLSHNTTHHPHHPNPTMLPLDLAEGKIPVLAYNKIAERSHPGEGKSSGASSSTTNALRDRSQTHQAHGHIPGRGWSEVTSRRAEKVEDSDDQNDDVARRRLHAIFRSLKMRIAFCTPP